MRVESRKWKIKSVFIINRILLSTLCILKHMKYPWVGISLAAMWFSSTYLILKTEPGIIDTGLILAVAIIGTIIVAFIGFRSPKIK